MDRSNGRQSARGTSSTTDSTNCLHRSTSTAASKTSARSFTPTSAGPRSRPAATSACCWSAYFENIDSQRGICWRFEDSLSLQRFIKLDVTGAERGKPETVPDHSSLSRIGCRLGEEVYEQVFAMVLELCLKHKLLSEEKLTAAVDSTQLEANAAMKSIVRRDTGEDWNQYVRRLMVEAGEAEDVDDPTDEEVRRFDQKRSKKNGGPGKKTSNKEWVSTTDPSAEITKMKDGRTHLAYKAEHVIDLNSEVILAAHITKATASDSSTLTESLGKATRNLENAEGSQLHHPAYISKRLVADKGYHSFGSVGRVLRDRLPDVHPGEKAQFEDRQTPLDRQDRRGVPGSSAESTSVWAGPKGNSISESEANEWNGASPTCARQAAVDEVGSKASKKFASDTRWRPRRGTWDW